jgi:hypothetical protein
LRGFSRRALRLCVLKFGGIFPGFAGSAHNAGSLSRRIADQEN